MPATRDTLQSADSVLGLAGGSEAPEHAQNNSFGKNNLMAHGQVIAGNEANLEPFAQIVAMVHGLSGRKVPSRTL